MLSFAKFVHWPSILFRYLQQFIYCIEPVSPCYGRRMGDVTSILGDVIFQSFNIKFSQTWFYKKWFARRNPLQQEKHVDWNNITVLSISI